MDKPTSLSVKQFIIRNMAVSSMLPEKTIEAVVNHQFNSMLEAMKTVYSVELSGFGKFLFNSTKANKKMKSYTNNIVVYEQLLLGDLPTRRRLYMEAKLKIIKSAKESLTPKIHEIL